MNKNKVLQAFEDRKSNKPKQKNNASLPAGAPMYFYCVHCGHLSDTLPESYTCIPKKVCDECQILVDNNLIK